MQFPVCHAGGILPPLLKLAKDPDMRLAAIQGLACLVRILNTSLKSSLPLAGQTPSHMMLLHIIATEKTCGISRPNTGLHKH